MRYGNQTPTFEIVCDYSMSATAQFIDLFKQTGTKFYPCQERELLLFGARDKDGNFASNSISISKPRQNGKSFSARKYALCAAPAGYAVAYTAHNGSTTREMFKQLSYEAEHNAHFSKRLENIVRGKGSEGLYFKGGGMIEFATRTDNNSRGKTYDINIIDEAQELTYDQLDALKPTTLASGSGDSQDILIGTPPSPKSKGEVFADKYEAAHKGLVNNACWLEWAASSVPNMLEREKVLELCYETNPALGYRIPEKKFVAIIEDYLKKPENFAREYLGWWCPVQKRNVAIDPDAWRECEIGRAPDGGRISFGVKFTKDGNFAAVAVCAIEDGKPHIELVDYMNIAADGLTKLERFIYDRKDKACLCLIDGKAGSEDLGQRLQADRMPDGAYKLCKTWEYTSACSMLVNSVRERAITHVRQQDIENALTMVSKRAINSNGAYGFDGDNAEIIDALALALYAARTTKRNPKRRAVVW